MAPARKYMQVEEEFESDGSDSEFFVTRLRNTWGSRVVIASLVGMVVLGLGTAGWLVLPLKAPTQAGTQPGAQPVESVLSTPEVQSAPQAASRFLSSEDLMSVVAKHSVKSNPHCQSPDSADWEICNEKALVPHLVKHMTKHVQKMPKVIRENLDTIMIHGHTQEGLKSALPHLGDPRFHAVAGDVVNGMKEVKGMTPEAAAKHLTEKLAPSKGDMDDLRKKLFPVTPPLDDANLAQQTLSSVLAGNGIHIQHDANDKNKWNTNFEINLQPHDLAKALESMPKGRELSSALFAPGIPPLGARAPTSGPPPADDLAGDIVAAIGLPFSHIVMAALHYEGKLSLPYWTKVVITVEDVLTLGAWSGFPLIGAICDFVFMWTPRGYVYPPGSASQYPPSFLTPEAHASPNQKAAYLDETAKGSSTYCLHPKYPWYPQVMCKHDSKCICRSGLCTRSKCSKCKSGEFYCRKRRTSLGMDQCVCLGTR